MLKWGNTEVTVVKWGSTTCTAVYWGSTKVYPDEITIFNAANSSTIFTIKCCNLGMTGAGGSYNFVGFVTSSSNGWNSGFTYGNDYGGIYISNSNPYKTTARSSSSINASSYTNNTTSIQMWGLNGKRGTSDGYQYTAAGVVLITKSAYDLSGKTSIEINLSSNIDSGSSYFICGISSLPTSYTTKFTANWANIGYISTNIRALSIPSGQSGNQYLMIGIAACAYPDCNYQDQFNATVTKVILK